jgi:hypothetical protein
MCAASGLPAKKITVDDIPDPALLEPDLEDKQKTAQEESLYKTRLRGLSQDIDERKKYAHRTFCLITCWLGGVFLLVLFQGFDGTATSQFYLDKTVLVTIISSTTASVLGIFIVVMHYLFPAKGPDGK